MAYLIFTDATADLTPELLTDFPAVEIIPMDVNVGGTQYRFGKYSTLPVPVLYELQRNGLFTLTSQINPQTYYDNFRAALMTGHDVLYLGFSSAMSACFQTARSSAERLHEEYPERKVICIDTLSASLGEGLLVLEAARHQAQGMDIDELAAWIMENRLNMCHWFTADSFDHLRHGGRISAASAALGSVLGIKPMLRLDDSGQLEVAEKTRGFYKAIDALLKHMEEQWEPKISQRVIIGHGDDWDKAKQLKSEVEKKFPNALIQLAYIGPIIGAHTGPGTLALFYWGNNR